MTKKLKKPRKYASKNNNNRKEITDKSNSGNGNNKNFKKCYILADTIVKKLRGYLF